MVACGVMRALVATVALLIGAPTVRAQPAHEVILVVADEPTFRGAVADAFAPTGMQIVPVDAPPPTLADIAKASRELTDREHATAVVWLVTAPDRATIVVYDRGVDRVLVRPLMPSLPLGAAHGAEAARMASTMLRALRVTPDLNAPPPRASEAPAIRAAAAVAPPPRRGASSTLAVAVGLGAREHLTGTSVAPAADGAVVWRPDVLGVAVAMSYAPSVDVKTSAFTGTASDLAFAALARVPVPLGVARLRVAGVAGPALHAITLRGTPTGTSGVDVTRYDAGARIGVLIGYALDPSVDVGVSVALDYLAEQQRFEVQGSEFLATPHVEVSTLLALVLRVL
jgi:hypothetical protein